MEPPNHQVEQIGEHPLKNHVILEQVFNFLNHSATFQDWKNVRLVCKTWHDETLVRWRNTAVLSFVRDGAVSEPLLPWKTTPRAFLNELQNAESPYKLREVPYQRYKFARIKIVLPDAENTAFWNLVGPKIKHLTLKKVKFIFLKGDQSVRGNIMSFFIETTPNLETLKLESVRDVGAYGPMPDAPHPNLKVLCIRSEKSDLKLNIFPNLQDLVLEKYDQMNFFKLFGNYLEPPLESGELKHSHVKRLDLMESKMGDKFLFGVTIPNVRFPSLEHFSVHLLTQAPYEYSEDDVRFLPTFVRNHRQTLKTLEVFTSIDKAPPEVGPLGTELPALTELRLWGNVVKNLGFLRFTPNLKLLHLDLSGVEKRRKMRKALIKNAGGWNGFNRNRMQVNSGILRSTVESGQLTGVVLRKLEYFQVNCALSPEDIRNLGDWMPNLKTLKTMLIAKTISAVCEKWPKLEHLVAFAGSPIRDRSITGNSYRNELKALVDFKCLRSFEYNEDCNKSFLTDECVVNGFLNMGELTRLKICVSPKFTGEAEHMLFERIQNVKVVRNYGEHSNWECCTNAAFRQFIRRFGPRKYPDDDSSVSSLMSNDSNSENEGQ